MASQFRAIISNKIIQAVDGFSIKCGGLKSSNIIPLVKVDTKKNSKIEFRLSMKSFMMNSLLKEEDQGSREDYLNCGSSIVKNFDTDLTIQEVSLLDEKTDVTIKFKVDPVKLIQEVIEITTQSPKNFWQRSAILTQIPSQKIVVEFSSPNIAKPFHVGHMRSTILGNFIANLHIALGHKVTKINYLGDWGTQFGLLKYAYDVKQMNTNDLEDDPLKKLYHLYVWANEQASIDPTIVDKAKSIFSSMENGDIKVLETWNLFRNLSIKDLEKTYSRLNVKFDEYHGESMYGARLSKDIINLMETNGLLKTHEDGHKSYLVKPNQKVIIVKRDGSSMYLSRDVAGAIDRFKLYNFDKMYYVVDSAQSDHFIALFSIIEKLGLPWASRLKHIRFGRIQGMSTRKGTAIFLKDLLNEARDLMFQKQKESKTTRANVLKDGLDTADQVAVSSVLIADMKQRRRKDYHFSWEQVLQTQGDTGIKLQYVHCRLANLKLNCGVTFSPFVDYKRLDEPEVINLVRQLARYDEVLLDCFTELEPCILVNYLFRLSGLINGALKTLPVKTAGHDTAKARLALFIAAQHVLASGLNILGLTPLEEM